MLIAHDVDDFTNSDIVSALSGIAVDAIEPMTHAFTARVSALRHAGSTDGVVAVTRKPTARYYDAGVDDVVDDLLVLRATVRALQTEIDRSRPIVRAGMTLTPDGLLSYAGKTVMLDAVPRKTLELALKSSAPMTVTRIVEAMRKIGTDMTPGLVEKYVGRLAKTFGKEFPVRLEEKWAQIETYQQVRVVG